MAITDLLGFAILAIATYMVVTRVIPYFRSSRLSKGDRNRLIQDAEQILESDHLSDEERHSVREALSTLRADAGRDRESWGGQLPVADAAETIRTARERHEAPPTEQ